MANYQSLFHVYMQSLRHRSYHSPAPPVDLSSCSTTKLIWKGGAKSLLKLQFSCRWLPGGR
jgi:hypothetical protein